MNEESLIDLRTKLNDIFRAAERITTVRAKLTQEDAEYLTDLTAKLGEHHTRITEIQGGVCGPQNTPWYRLAWSKVKRVPVLTYNRVTQLHWSSCRRSTEIIEQPGKISRKTFFTFLLTLCLLYYTSCGGIVAFYNFFPECPEVTTTANITNVIPDTETSHVADIVHPKQMLSILAIAFPLLVTTLSLLSLVLKFATLFPWSMYYSFWLVIYLFKDTPRPEQTEGQ
jgi:hypothetical protein